MVAIVGVIVLFVVDESRKYVDCGLRLVVELKCCMQGTKTDSIGINDKYNKRI